MSEEEWELRTPARDTVRRWAGRGASHTPPPPRCHTKDSTFSARTASNRINKPKVFPNITGHQNQNDNSCIYIAHTTTFSPICYAQDVWIWVFCYGHENVAHVRGQRGTTATENSIETFSILQCLAECCLQHRSITRRLIWVTNHLMAAKGQRERMRRSNMLGSSWHHWFQSGVVKQPVTVTPPTILLPQNARLLTSERRANWTLCTC